MEQMLCCLWNGICVKNNQYIELFSFLCLLKCMIIHLYSNFTIILQYRELLLLLLPLFYTFNYIVTWFLWPPNHDSCTCRKSFTANDHILSPRLYFGKSVAFNYVKGTFWSVSATFWDLGWHGCISTHTVYCFFMCVMFF